MAASPREPDRLPPTRASWDDLRILLAVVTHRRARERAGVARVSAALADLFRRERRPLAGIAHAG